MSAKESINMFLLDVLGPRSTGVEGVVIWVAAGEFSSLDPDLGPRIKVVLGKRIAADTLRDAPLVLLTKPPQLVGDLPANVANAVIKFASLNRETLLRYWGGEGLGTSEMLDLIRAV